MESKKGSKKMLLVTVAVILVAVYFGGQSLFKKYFNKSPQEQQTQVIDKVSFSFPAGWAGRDLNDAEKKAGIIAYQKRKQPDATLIFRKIPGKLDDQVDIQELPDAIVTSFAEKLTDFKLIEKKVTTIGGFQTAQVRYQRTDNQQGVVESVIYIIPTANQTFYLTYGARQADFAQIENDIDTINEAFVGQIR